MKVSASSGFTLVEILAVVACVSVLATVALISTQESVSASRMAALQRELQTLNTALVNFRGAGGVVPEGADARRAVEALQVGTELGGETYKALLTTPEFTRPLEGTTYFLKYDEGRGFTYEASDPTSSMSYVGAGGTAEASGGAFVFDITNVGAFDAAVAEFVSLLPDDPRYPGFLEAFGATRMLGTLPISSLVELDDLLFAEGLKFNPQSGNYEQMLYFGQPVIPSEPVLDFPVFEEGFADYTPRTLTPDWDANEWAWVGETLKGEDRDFWWNEMNLAYRQAGPGSQTFFVQEGEVQVRRLGVEKIDWAKVDTAGMSLAGVDMTGSNLTVAQLNSAGYINAIKATGMDLTALQTFGKALYAADLSGSVIDPSQLVNSSGLDYITLRGAVTPLGTPITKAVIVDALITAGKWGTPGFDTETMVF
jgi:prepilin-type N-terminal cleavage/methylation domain-containing protein